MYLERLTDRAGGASLNQGSSAISPEAHREAAASAQLTDGLKPGRDGADLLLAQGILLPGVPASDRDRIEALLKVPFVLRYT